MRDVTRMHGDVFSEVPKLGPAVTSSLPPPPEKTLGPPLELDVDDDQNINSRYVLSGAQRGLIINGHGSDRSTKNRKILKKRDHLPERIQHLVDDVAVLYGSPYFSDELWEQGMSPPKEKHSKFAELQRWAQNRDFTEEELREQNFEERDVEHYDSPFDSAVELWDELIDIKQRSQQVRDDVFFHGNSVVSKETQFGYEIGSILRMLRPNYGDFPPGADLIWGFMLAFVGQPLANMDREQEVIASLVEDLNSRSETRQIEAEQMPEPDKIMELGADFDEVTAEAIGEMGITPHPIVVREVRYHQPVLEDSELKKKAAKRVVADLIDVVPLRELDELGTRVTQDLGTMRERSVPGTESIQQILGAYLREENSEGDENNNSGNEETTDVAEKRFVRRLTTPDIANTIGIDKSSISTILNRITSDHESELWTTNSLVHRKEESGRRVSWELTNYGELLLHVNFKREAKTDILYWFALGPEEISLSERKLVIDALDELDLMN